MSVKLTVAKPTFNALTDTNPKNFKFHSDYGTLKYFQQGSITVTLAGGDLAGRGVLTHSLGYYPFAEVHEKLDSGSFHYCPNYAAGATVFYETYFIITTTQILFYVSTTGFVSSHTWTFRYFLFANNLGL